MCLIIKKEKGLVPSTEFFENVYLFNRDGWGIMMRDNDQVLSYKGDKLEDLIYAVKQLKNTLAYIHMRKATVGEVSPENTHPFKLVNGAGFMHNGTIKNIEIPKEEKRSDSLLFVEMLNNLMRKWGEDILFDPTIKEIIKGFIDSRILILFPDGRELIITDIPWYFYEKEKLLVSNLYAWDLWDPRIKNKTAVTVLNVPFSSTTGTSNTAGTAALRKAEYVRNRDKQRAKPPIKLTDKHLFTGNFYNTSI